MIRTLRYLPLPLFALPVLLLFLLLLSTPRSSGQSGAKVPDPDPEIERKSFKVADGFEVNLWAADPLLAKPIQINFDARGRLWVELSGRLQVLWGRADGTREPGELDDAGKLERLIAWFNDHPTSLPNRPRFLAFDHDHVVVVQPRDPS